MHLSQKPILLLLLTLLLLGGILIWRTWIYRGELTIISPAPFTLQIKTGKQLRGEILSCNELECTYKLPARTYRLTIQPENYEVFTQEVKILWNQNHTLEFEPQKVPQLIAIEKSVSNHEESALQKNYFFEETGQLFLKKDNGNVFLADFSFLDTTAAQIIPDPYVERAFVLLESFLFEVDVQKKQKFEILSFPEAPGRITLHPLQKNMLLLGKDDEISLFFLENRTSFTLSEVKNPNLVCQNPENSEEIFFAIQDANWHIKRTSLPFETSEGVASYPFDSAIENIECEKESSLMLHTKEESFRLEF